MKKIIFLLAMTTFLFSDFAMQAQTEWFANNKI